MCPIVFNPSGVGDGDDNDDDYDDDDDVVDGFFPWGNLRIREVK